MSETTFDFNPLRFAAWVTIFAIGVTVLVLGKALLVPLAIAIFIWVLLTAIKSLLIRSARNRVEIPDWLGNVLAISIVVAATYFSVALVSSQSDELIAAIPVYQANLSALFADLQASLNIDYLPTTESVLSEINFSAILTAVGDSVTTLMSDLILIAIYVGFLMSEEHILPQKLRHLDAKPAKAERIAKVATEVGQSVQRYIGMKTIVSALTGLVSYVILKIVGVDFAAIWALLVFFLNFIPTIGSMIAVVFPALLTLVQFDTMNPFLIVVIGLGGTQFVIGNVIEPAYMGRSLNLSPLMILLSLSFWGAVWGLPGMFLSVPLMVMTGIVCAQIEGLRWVAVILSVDGELVQVD